MNILIVLFFLFNVFATAALGSLFIKKGAGNHVFKTFGIALLINAIAFAVWSFGVVRPESLLKCVTLGTVAFLISLVFLFYTSVQKIHASINRKLLIILSIIVVIGLFFIGHADPSYAYISPEGFLFFNLGPLMQMLYVFVLALTILPAIDLVASKFKSIYSIIFRYGFIAQVCGGIMLMTTKDSQVLYVTGWAIILVYFLLLITFLFNKKAWFDLN